MRRGVPLQEDLLEGLSFAELKAIFLRTLYAASEQQQDEAASAPAAPAMHFHGPVTIVIGRAEEGRPV